jgi:hypothetical protein
MEKTNQNLLQKLTQILNVDKIISPEDIEAIRDALIGVLANNKKELENLTDETKQAVNSILDKVLNEHDTYLEKTKQIAQEAKSETTEAINSTLKSLEEVKVLCKEVMECKPENGEDADEEYVIGEVLNRIKLPEYKEIVLDDGGAIVDKINSLPVNEENQIDAKHIKNLPEVKGGRVISGGVTRKIVEQMIAATSSGSPGGSTTQLQYNNAGAFGGISGATTDGTAVTYTANNLKAADITASGSGGFLIQSNSGTDVGLFGAGGGAGATFYGGVNISGNLTVDTNTLYVDATNNVVGIGTASPLTQTGNKLQVGDNSAANQYLVFQTNNSTERGIQYYLADGTTLRGYMKWDGEEDLLLKGDTFKFSTGTVADHMHLNDTGLGLRTLVPTHTLTLASTSTGIALYNTADQTTNYERVVGAWSGNIFTFAMTKGGTGTDRAVNISSGGMVFSVDGNGTSIARSTSGTALSTGAFRITGTQTQSSGLYSGLGIAPTINQSSTAGYTALLVNPTETTTGSGSKLLADFQVGGTTKAAISNTGYLGIGAVATYPIDIQLALAQQQIKSTTGTNYVITRYNNTGGDFYVGRESSTGGAVLAGTTAYSAVLASGGAYSMHFGTNNTIGLTISSAQVVTIPNNSIITANAITATANAATIPVTKGRNIVTNNSAATLTITLTTSGAVNMQTVIVQILDFSAAAQTLTFVNTENSTVSVPATTNGSTTLPLTVGFIYNAATSKWRCIASA